MSQVDPDQVCSELRSSTPALASAENASVLSTQPALVYLDHAATTPLGPAAAAAWEANSHLIGNPSSRHSAGRVARRLVEESRERLAAALGVDPYEIVFTAGGTEADNLAVLGIARARRVADPDRRRVLVSAVEHPAVLEAARQLAGEGFEVVELPVDREGRLDLAVAQAVIEADPAGIALISCQAVNNETGTIQPLAELASLAAPYQLPLHSDYVQALAYTTPDALPASNLPGPPPAGLADLSGLAALSLSGHKLGAPVGIGALVVRRDCPIQPISYGGGQERNLRSGTLPAVLIAAFAAAAAQVVAERAEESARLSALADRLRAGLTTLNQQLLSLPRTPGETTVILRAVAESIPRKDCDLSEPVNQPDAIQLVGPADPALRSPHIVTAVFPHRRGDDLLLLLDRAGIACSTGSACTAGVARESHVLVAMGCPWPSSALRFSFGSTTTAADIDALLACLPNILDRCPVVD